MAELSRIHLPWMHLVCTWCWVCRQTQLITGSLLKAAPSTFGGQTLAHCLDRKKAVTVTLSQAFPASTEPLNTVTHSLLASFFPQQLRQQEAAAAEAEEKEEMEIAEGKQLASKRGSGAAKGRTRA